MLVYKKQVQPLESSARKPKHFRVTNNSPINTAKLSNNTLGNSSKECSASVTQPLCSPDTLRMGLVGRANVKIGQKRRCGVPETSKGERRPYFDGYGGFGDDSGVGGGEE